MLETLWYLLLLTLQILQVNPELKSENLQIDVYVASKPAYTFSVQGSAVQGQIINSEKRSVFGEFEATRRVPQAYVIFPREALAAELEDAAKSSKGGAANPPSGATKTPVGPQTGAEKQAELVPVTIDFTKALKQLVSFKVKNRQQIEYPEMSKFMGDGDSEKAGANAARSSTTTIQKSSMVSTTIGKGVEQKEKDGMIEIRQYANRLVLNADFAQMVIIVSFPPEAE